MSNDETYQTPCFPTRSNLAKPGYTCALRGLNQQMGDMILRLWQFVSKISCSQSKSKLTVFIMSHLSKRIISWICGYASWDLNWRLIIFFLLKKKRKKKVLAKLQGALATAIVRCCLHILQGCSAWVAQHFCSLWNCFIRGCGTAFEGPTQSPPIIQS